MASYLEQEAHEWIESVSGESFTGSSFADSLKDGVILCKCVRGSTAHRSRARLARSRAPSQLLQRARHCAGRCPPPHMLRVPAPLASPLPRV